MRFSGPPRRHDRDGLWDLFTDGPASGWFPKWIAGVVVAGFFVGYGVYCGWGRRAYLPSFPKRTFHVRNRFQWIEYYGEEAVAIGLVAIFVGLAFHFQWYWGNHPKLVYVYDPLKYLAALLAGASVVWFIVLIFRW